MVDPGGHQGRPSIRPISFWGKISQIIGWHPHLSFWCYAPIGKFWIRYWYPLLSTGSNILLSPQSHPGHEERYLSHSKACDLRPPSLRFL